MIQTDKEKAIATAMAKLSPEEQELLGLVKPKTPDANSTLRITLNYTIVSSSGEYTTKIPDIRRDNPYLPILLSSLDHLSTIPGKWGICFTTKHLDGNLAQGSLSQGSLSQIEYDFLSIMLRPDDEDKIMQFLKDHGFYQESWVEDEDGFNEELDYHTSSIYDLAGEYAFRDELANASFLLFESYSVE